MMQLSALCLSFACSSSSDYMVAECHSNIHCPMAGMSWAASHNVFVGHGQARAVSGAQLR
ncbi:hypothetical protein HBH56_144770 [Parastagonospora nodorum]|uniref:Uncharacterized protein n=1 Tax=Phaeosphaeria nodorum (strain SN15 / ATCC MYA-4574 / FGSC 10173) TaxID=321614 RepID=A0A7U2I6P0_PHANO|nr:hypothetical protein HBH56_144770 [Parastagonospora nodorum]QRD01383.1 hypothetical protein JI435_120540 [Parastagonospora nodorum SN15]KAH3927747.1 hypothetical protein HBH54_149960 [Parastagonospora nodorum]KAH3947791.1 hypothetical protein HBH53_110000 [Parastagonospora nodorum]KAH3960239.1 hypothetical protein HBH51_193820 [Parastagonospora nodorum]